MTEYGKDGAPKLSTSTVPSRSIKTPSVIVGGDSLLEDGIRNPYRAGHKNKRLALDMQTHLRRTAYIRVCMEFPRAIFILAILTSSVMFFLAMLFYSREKVVYIQQTQPPEATVIQNTQPPRIAKYSRFGDVITNGIPPNNRHQQPGDYHHTAPLETQPVSTPQPSILQHVDVEQSQKCPAGYRRSRPHKTSFLSRSQKHASHHIGVCELNHTLFDETIDTRGATCPYSFRRDIRNKGKNWVMTHYDARAEDTLDRVLFHTASVLKGGDGQQSSNPSSEEEKHSKLMGFFRSCLQHFGEKEAGGGVTVKVGPPEKGVDDEYLRLLDTIDAVENWGDLSRVFGVLSVRNQPVPFELHLYPARVDAKDGIHAYYDIHHPEIAACPSGWILPPETSIRNNPSNWTPSAVPLSTIREIIEQEGCAFQIGGSSDALAKAYVTVSRYLWGLFEDSMSKDVQDNTLFSKITHEVFRTQVIERSGISLDEYIRGMEEEMAFAAFSWKTSLHRATSAGVRMETHTYFEQLLRLDRHDLSVWKNYLRAGLCLQSRTTRISPEVEQSLWFRRSSRYANACRAHSKVLVDLNPIMDIFSNQSTLPALHSMGVVDSLCARLTSFHMAHVINRYIYGEMQRSELSPFSADLESVRKLFGLIVDTFKSSLEERSSHPLQSALEWNSTLVDWVKTRVEKCTLHLEHTVHEEVSMARLRMSYTNSYIDNVLHAKGFETSVVLVDAPRLFEDHMKYHLERGVGNSNRDKASAEMGPWVDLFLRPRLWRARFEYLEEWNVMLVSPVHLERPLCDAISVSPLLKRRGEAAASVPLHTQTLSLATISRAGYMLSLAIAPILEPALDKASLPDIPSRRETLRTYAQQVHTRIYTDKAKEEASKIWHERTRAGLEEASLQEASERDAREAVLYRRQNSQVLECGCERQDDGEDEEATSNAPFEWHHSACRTLLMNAAHGA